MKHFIIINGLNVRHIEAVNMADGITNAQNYSDHSKEIILREIEPKITYYLIGDDAVRELNNEGFEGLLTDIEQNNTCYSVFAFIEGITKSVELAEALDGWENYATITKEEYDQL